MAPGINPGLMEINVLHRIVTPVACPELQIVKGGRRGNQCVTRFYMMASRETTKVFTSAMANVSGATIATLTIAAPTSSPLASFTPVYGLSSDPGMATGVNSCSIGGFDTPCTYRGADTPAPCFFFGGAGVLAPGWPALASAAANALIVLRSWTCSECYGGGSAPAVP